jgi:hypothetical protein
MTDKKRIQILREGLKDILRSGDATKWVRARAAIALGDSEIGEKPKVKA